LSWSGRHVWRTGGGGGGEISHMLNGNTLLLSTQVEGVGCRWWKQDEGLMHMGGRTEGRPQTLYGKDGQISSCLSPQHEARGVKKWLQTLSSTDGYTSPCLSTWQRALISMSSW
jgi:hypothetical protein